MEDNMKKILGLVLFALLIALPRLSSATIVDDRTFSGANCGGDCFGLTYHLVVDDLGNLADGTYSATLTITGTYTGTMTFIGAVDIKIGDIQSPPNPTLTTAPGVDGNWTTLWLNGQAATNCQNGLGAFLCSYDEGQNTEAPVANGGAVNDTWAWNLTLASAYTFGHLGVNFTNATDGCNTAGQFDCTDGQNMSVSSGGTPRVPEPGSFVLLGVGLVALGVSMRKRFSQQ